MATLTSISKPVSIQEAVVAQDMEVRREHAGSNGTAASSGSLSVDAYVLSGKGSPTTAGIESVIGIDERNRILDTDQIPWRRVCALRMFNSSGAFVGFGSGWLAGRRTVITAGHCVNHDAFGGWAGRIEVSPGRNGGQFPFATVHAVGFSSTTNWVNDRNPDFDIGVIHLPSDKPLGDTLGWFAFANLTTEELQDHLVNVTGYPGDLAGGTLMYHHGKQILHVTPRRIFYDTDTAAGQSGGPAWIRESPTSSPIAVGIHAYGTAGTPFSLGITANSAPRINADVFDLIDGWVTADNDNNP